MMAFLLLPTAAQAQFTGTNGRIIWTSPISGQYTIKSDGTNPNATSLATISAGGVDDWQSIYTPNGNYIITMGVASSGAASNIYVTNAAHTITPVAITTFTTCNVVDPAVNSSGTKIAFGCTAGSGNQDLYVIDLNISGSTISGSNQIKLTNQINSVGTFNPVWAPDNSVIYARNQNNIISISPTTANQTTGDETVIYQAGASLVLNDVNPAGTKLLYRGVTTQQLFTVGVDGTGNAQLTTDATGNYGGGYYSPDGTRVVASKQSASSDQQLVTMNSTTGASETVIHSLSADTVGVLTTLRPMWGTNQDTYADSNNGNLTPTAPNTSAAKNFTKNYTPIAIASAAATLFVALVGYFAVTELKKRKRS